MTRLREYACPHCGRRFAPCSGPAHTLTCIEAPDMADRVRAALEDPDSPGVALSERGYDERAAQYNAAGHSTLVRAWGPTWADVARRVGLEPGQRAGTKKGTNTKAQKEATEARAIAETEEALARDAELREYWSGGRGLPVCDTPRQLADGRLAWMVR